MIHDNKIYVLEWRLGDPIEGYVWEPKRALHSSYLDRAQKEALDSLHQYVKVLGERWFRKDGKLNMANFRIRRYFISPPFKRASSNLSNFQHDAPELQGCSGLID